MGYSETITKYYDETAKDYKLIWHTGKHLSMHMGYSDEDALNHDKAVVRMISELSTRARITRNDAVVDLGCGVGGSSIWLAKNIGCSVIGIDMNARSINISNTKAKKSGLSGLVTFIQDDFTNLTLTNNTKDVCWFLESLCHAPDKYLVLKEATRLLLPNGRIIVADGFKVTEGEELDIWLDGWAVPNLATTTQFKSWLEMLGFSKIAFENITIKVLPSVERLYHHANSLLPVGRVMKKVGMRTEVQTRNILGGINAYKSLIKGQWCYGIFLAERD